MSVAYKDIQELKLRIPEFDKDLNLVRFRDLFLSMEKHVNQLIGNIDHTTNAFNTFFSGDYTPLKNRINDSATGLDAKLNKSGGTITGDVNAGGELTVDGEVTINDNLTADEATFTKVTSPVANLTTITSTNITNSQLVKSNTLEAVSIKLTEQTEFGQAEEEFNREDINEFKVAYTHSQITNGTNPHGVLPQNIGDHGVVPLNEHQLIDSVYLPSYVDDVIGGYYKSDDGLFYEDSEFTTEITYQDNNNDTQTGGQTGKIYKDLSTNLIYRWSSSTGYVNLAETARQTGVDESTLTKILDEASNVQEALETLDNLDSRYFRENELLPENGAGALDTRYYTEAEVDALVNEGATTVTMQRFVITNEDTGSGEFGYTYEGGAEQLATLNANEHTFALEDGVTYLLGENRVEVKINNDITFYASDAELTEIDNSTIKVDYALSNGDEVHLKIYEGIDSFASRVTASDITISPEVYAGKTTLQETLQRAKELIGNAGASDHTYYVDPAGSDDNEGSANNPFKTIKKATEVVAALDPIGSLSYPPYSDLYPYVAIRINSGTYNEQLPIVVPRNTSLVGTDLRTVRIYPAQGLSDDGVTDNNESQMFQMGPGTLAINLALYGMTGWEKPTDTEEPETTTAKGVGFALDPNAPIQGASPYILDCSAFFPGGIGAYVDGSVHAAGQKSMLFYAYTNINDEGVGCWANNGGVIELVSDFTYYAEYGYLATNGGYLRALNGSNSWGNWGLFATGFLPEEVAITGTLKGNLIEFIGLSGAINDGDTITGETSGATATVLSMQEGASKIYIDRTSAEDFVDGETLLGPTGSCTSVGVEQGQSGAILVVTNLTEEPEIRSSISLAGDDATYVISLVSGTYADSNSTMILTLAQEKTEPSAGGTTVAIRKRYSQIRVTGHDFLNIGVGGTGSIFVNGGTLINPGTPPVQSRQVGEFNTGRVFAVSTDQDGNFRVGKYFAIDQGTGRATLDASAFDLSGLTSLRLGAIGAQIGESINEFSSDATLSQNSNQKVATQAAVKTYIDTRFDGELASIKDAAEEETTSGFLKRNSNGDHVYETVNVNSIVGNLTINEDVEESPGASTLSVDSDNGLTISADLIVAGDLIVQGTETILNTTTLQIEDKNIVLGSVETPTDVTADGGGFTLKGATDKTFTYSESDERWESNIPIDATGLTVNGEALSTAIYKEFTIPSSGWSANTDYYSATVNVADVLDTDTPVIDINLDGVSFNLWEDLEQNWAVVKRATTNNGSITFDASDVPENNIPVRIKIVR